METFESPHPSTPTSRIYYTLSSTEIARGEAWVARERPTWEELKRHLYSTLLFRNPDAVEFLWSDHFSNALKALINEPHLRATCLCDADRSIDQFRRFIALKAFVADTDPQVLNPMPLMDIIWLAAICNTTFYAEMRLAVTALRHWKRIITCAKTGTVRDLMQHIENAGGYPVWLQALIHEGVRLDVNKALAEYGVQDASHVFATTRI